MARTYLVFEGWRITLRAFACQFPRQLGWLAEVSARATLIVILSVGTLHPSGAFAGDPRSLALGAHLAKDCSSCHALPSRKAPEAGAIPSIYGRPPAEIVSLLQLYATGVMADGRAANTTMSSVAQSLKGEEMAALADYLESVRPARP